MQPQSVVLLVTPKMLPDFARPEPAVTEFFQNYNSLTSRAAETIVVFAVGNSDHILNYRGRDYWSERVEWARTTDFIPVSDRALTYADIDRIAHAFRAAADAAGVNLKLFEHIDSGGEFTVSNTFKYSLHAECTANKWGMFDIRGRLQADTIHYATSPSGIAEGKSCGEFLAEQVATYVHDFAFDGILYDNQLGTRGRWRPGDGPGYSIQEANAIRAFFEYTRRALAGASLMWFDSYNPVSIERETFSVPAEAYGYFDYLIASGFCAVSGEQYPDNLRSKIGLENLSRVLATLDYVDPWYSYSSMTDHRTCSEKLEKVAIERRHDIDGVMFFANDRDGRMVPRAIVDSFASRFFAPR
jgi:hypothetical protein